MSLKSRKLRKIVYKFKAIIGSLIIAFFFSAFFIFVVALIFGDTIHKGLSILNTLSLEMNIGKNENISYDPLEKKLDVLPSWGTQFATLKIESIGVDVPVFHGDDMIQLSQGAGHYLGSQFPGEGGSIILAGHNVKGMFHDLPNINIGDKIQVNTIYGDFEYEVYETKIDDYRNEDAFPIQNEEEILILYTCFPINNVWYVTDRYIVYAKLVGDQNG